MHVASPALPESALRLLFYRAVATQHTTPSVSGGNSEGGDIASHRGARQSNTGSRVRRESMERSNRIGTEGGKGSSVGEGTKSGGNGVGGVKSVTPADLARAVVDFPLACEGLASLINATASTHGVRELLKQAVFRAKEAIEEAEKVFRSHLFSEVPSK